MFRRNMEEEAANGKPELSKKAHQAFKNITGTVSKDDGLGDIATWTTPEWTKVARGHDEVLRGREDGECIYAPDKLSSHC